MLITALQKKSYYPCLKIWKWAREVQSLARGSAEARNKFVLCAVVTSEDFSQRPNSSPGNPSCNPRTTLPSSAPEHLLMPGHFFQWLVPPPLRGDFSSSLGPLGPRTTHPQHPLVTLAPWALNFLPVPLAGQACALPPIPSACAVCSRSSQPLCYWCLYYTPTTQTPPRLLYF